MWEVQIIIEQRPKNPLKNTKTDTVPIGIWILGASNTVIHDPQSQQPTATKKKTKTKGAKGTKGMKGMTGMKGMKGMTEKSEKLGDVNKVKGYLKASSLSLRCSLPLGTTPWDLTIVRRRENKERRRRRERERERERQRIR